MAGPCFFSKRLSWEAKICWCSLPVRLLPPITSERYPPALIEANSLTLEQQALSELRTHAAAPLAHHPAGIDHPLPRHSAPSRKGVHRVPHETRLSTQSRQGSDLAVCRHAAARDPTHHRVDARVAAVALRPDS